MKLLLRLSALFAVAALVALAAGAQTASIDMGPFSGGRLVTPIGPRTYPVPDPGPTYPHDAYVVYQPDPQCPGIGNVLPDSAKSICMRTKAIEYLIQEVQNGRLAPGPAWKDCTYPSAPEWRYCVEFSIKAHVPEIRWGMSRVYLFGILAQVPTWVCAGGVAYDGFIRVSLHDGATHAYTWTAWETINSALHYHLDRKDLTDSAFVGVGTNWAASQCGVN